MVKDSFSFLSEKLLKTNRGEEPTTERQQRIQCSRDCCCKISLSVKIPPVGVLLFFCLRRCFCFYVHEWAGSWCSKGQQYWLQVLGCSLKAHTSVLALAPLTFSWNEEGESMLITPEGESKGMLFSQMCIPLSVTWCIEYCKDVFTISLPPPSSKHTINEKEQLGPSCSKKLQINLQYPFFGFILTNHSTICMMFINLVSGLTAALKQQTNLSSWYY